MIKIELDESEARELLNACHDKCWLCLDNMEAIEARFGSNAGAKIFYDEEYKTAFFHAAKLAGICAKIEDSLNRK